jgi:hypothetical protein
MLKHGTTNTIRNAPLFWQRALRPLCNRSHLEGPFLHCRGSFTAVLPLTKVSSATCMHAHAGSHGERFPIITDDGLKP